MKKFIALILALAFALSLCACSSDDADSTPSETPSPAITKDVIADNPMFVDIGQTVTIDGVEWNASCMFFNPNTNKIQSSDRHSYFMVNRVNRHVFLVYSSYGKSGVAYAVDTGLIYEGDIVVDGTNTIVPTN